jgi:cytochrome c biogenesis protein CcdA
MLALTMGAAFAAGAATSIGPCAAPRYLALAALTANARGWSRWLRVGLFALGLMLCYAVLAQTAGAVRGLIQWSAYVYAALAVLSLFFGLRALVLAPRCAHGASHGAALLAGGAMGLVISPCCSPVIIMAASIATADSLWGTLIAAAAFALGHVAPLATLTIGLRDDRFAPAARVVAGGLSIALAGYYGILA